MDSNSDSTAPNLGMQTTTPEAMRLGLYLPGGQASVHVATGVT
jgi:hypothetical protein